jgi:hypothetical protein
MGAAEGFAVKNNPNFATDPVWSTFHVEQTGEVGVASGKRGKTFHVKRRRAPTLVRTA